MSRHTPGLENICGKEGCGFCPKCRSLMDAAPELLEALKAYQVGNPKTCACGYIRPCVWCAARAAIGKAEGK